MKRIKLVLIALLSFLMVPAMVSAANANITVSSNNQGVVGNKITVTVKLSSSTSIGSWQMKLNYDSSYLKLNSSTAEAGGTIMSNSSSGTKSKSYTFTFTVLKSGSTNVSVGSYLAYAYGDMSEMKISTSAKTIKLVTQQQLQDSYSTNNNLSSLSVEGYDISPAFNKDTLEYTVELPNGTESINVKASKADNKSTVSGVGKIEVNEGANKISVVVTAQNGSSKTYVINVNVKELDPINVSADGKEYTVIRKREQLETPLGYEETTVIIDENEVPSYYSEVTKYTLVGLKDSEGNVSLFIYDSNNDTYIKYTEISFSGIIFYPMDVNSKDIPDGYKDCKVTIGEDEVICYKTNDDSNFVLIYGMNTETGNTGWYVYDKEEGTLQRFNEQVVEEANDKANLYLYVAIGFAGVLALVIIIMLINLGSKNKKLKKLKTASNKFEKVNKE